MTVFCAAPSAATRMTGIQVACLRALSTYMAINHRQCNGYARSIRVEIVRTASVCQNERVIPAFSYAATASRVCRCYRTVRQFEADELKLPRLLHRWNVSPKQAVSIQRKLARRVIPIGETPRLHLAAGADCAFSSDREECIAAVVVWDVAARQVVEQIVVRRTVRFPYVPGLLTFREAPAILAAIRKLRREPDVFFFDGQGYAHPRRFGLACHLGVLMDRPSLGCAKSILIGEADAPGVRCGSTAPLVHNGEQIGSAVRTRDGVKPVYVSVGHRLSLAAAVEIVLACGAGFRLPEPTRRADILVGHARTVR